MTTILRALGIACLAVVVAGATIWAALALYYSDLPGEPLRIGLAAAFVLVTLVMFVLLGRRWGLAGFAASFALVLLWWSSIEPANERDWQTDVAVLPYATRDGDLVTLHNIRNFAYRNSDKDFVPLYEERTFDLRELDEVDLIAVYWMGDAIAHVMVSFGFAGDYVTFSIETRKEEGEAYSAIAGFFKRYELIYVVGDERDLIRVRTSFRQPAEQVYLYRTRMNPDNGRRLFLEYIDKINQLKDQPEFYDTLTTNCTTDVWSLARALSATRVALDWRVLLSGYFPAYAYDLGSLDTSMPFEELKARSLINDEAHAAGDDPGFSARIREGLPRPPPREG